MGGIAVTAKYIIHANIEVEGRVEPSDVIGAIFGQTEGLLGPELDLRELQKSGRIGRILVDLQFQGNKTFGKIRIPSSLDRIETALVAAAVEVVDKVGPYPAKIRVERIVDVRKEKRRRIIERAKELLLKWEQEEAPDTRELKEAVLKALKVSEIISYGPEKLPAGPDIDKSDTIIIVEGRADVVNLVRHGYRNVIAIGGAQTKIPKTIIELCKRKKAIAFVDGDRVGELILRELLREADIDYIARAPPGREVEDLSAKEIAKCLKNKVSAKEYLMQVERERPHRLIIPARIKEDIRSLRGTLEAILYDEKYMPITRVPVRDLVETLESIDGVKAVVFDGVITQRLVDAAARKGVSILIGVRKGEIRFKPYQLKILTFNEV